MNNTSGLKLDLYNLTMAHGFFLKQYNPTVTFEMFFRSQPYHGGFSIFAGLETLLQEINDFRYDTDDINYLQSLDLFDSSFFDFLAEFQFSGELLAQTEGDLIFPNVPIIQVSGKLLECILLEGIILNTINFQSLIATKSARIKNIIGEKSFFEFGFRRAQGIDGAMSASRGAYIGGTNGTSFVEAAKELGIQVSGTMAHAWIMAFDDERKAFEMFAEIYPQRPIFLIDTYDTLGSGITNAIAVGKKLLAAGNSFAVRIDSGDLEYLSKKVRQKLDAHGCQSAGIFVTNDLDEYIIEQLENRNSPIDGYGVGTHLSTGGAVSSFNGIYKIVELNSQGVMKLSSSPEKITTPSAKKTLRFFDENKTPIADVLFQKDEIITSGQAIKCCHLAYEHSSMTLKPAQYSSFKELLQPVLQQGKRVSPPRSLDDIRAHCLAQVNSLPSEYKRLINPHRYQVSLSKHLKETKSQLIEKMKEEKASDSLWN